MLDMSKLESEEIVLENKDFDINRLLHEIREVIEKQVYERGISLSEKEYNLKYRYLNGSPVHLKRILMNIISNAVKYNKEKERYCLAIMKHRWMTGIYCLSFTARIPELG